MYGFLVSFGILSALLISEKIAKREKRNIDLLWEMSFWVIIVGVIGARLYHVLDYLPYYLENPIKIFLIWHGGLGIIGGLLFGFLTSIIYLKIKRQDVMSWLDILVVGIPLAQAIGRWGNFFNKELYGIKTNLPWGIYEKELGYRVHPLFLYESLLNLILFFILLKTKGRLGTRFFIYLAGYSVIRFFLEFLRDRTWIVYNLNVAQVISILILGVSTYFLTKK